MATKNQNRRKPDHLDLAVARLRARGDVDGLNILRVGIDAIVSLDGDRDRQSAILSDVASRYPKLLRRCAGVEGGIEVRP